MSDTTLSTERIRDLYTCATAWHSDYPGTKTLRASNRAEFDRWLAAHDAGIRADERMKALELAQKVLAGEDTVEWARNAHASSLSLSHAIWLLDSAIEDVRAEIAGGAS